MNSKYLSFFRHSYLLTVFWKNTIGNIVVKVRKCWLSAFPFFVPTLFSPLLDKANNLFCLAQLLSNMVEWCEKGIRRRYFLNHRQNKIEYFAIYILPTELLKAIFCETLFVCMFFFYS